VLTSALIAAPTLTVAAFDAARPHLADIAALRALRRRESGASMRSPVECGRAPACQFTDRDVVAVSAPVPITDESGSVWRCQYGGSATVYLMTRRRLIPPCCLRESAALRASR
jgi:hypothetical protein